MVGGPGDTAVVLHGASSPAKLQPWAGKWVMAVGARAESSIIQS